MRLRFRQQAPWKKHIHNPSSLSTLQETLPPWNLRLPRCSPVSPPAPKPNKSLRLPRPGPLLLLPWIPAHSGLPVPEASPHKELLPPCFPASHRRELPAHDDWASPETDDISECEVTAFLPHPPLSLHSVLPVSPVSSHTDPPERNRECFLPIPGYPRLSGNAVFPSNT